MFEPPYSLFPVIGVSARSRFTAPDWVSSRQIGTSFWWSRRLVISEFITICLSISFSISVIGQIFMEGLLEKVKELLFTIGWRRFWFGVWKCGELQGFVRLRTPWGTKVMLRCSTSWRSKICIKKKWSECELPTKYNVLKLESNTNCIPQDSYLHWHWRNHLHNQNLTMPWSRRIFPLYYLLCQNILELVRHSTMKQTTLTRGTNPDKKQSSNSWVWQSKLIYTWAV